MQKTKYLIIVICLMCCTYTLKAQKNESEKRINEYNRAVELFEKSKYASAQKAFKTFLNKKETNTNDNYLVNAYYYDAVCAACGKEAKVPFKPTEDRPVYCSECFAKMKEEQA